MAATTVTYNWNTLSMINSQMQDQVIDFVANPLNQIMFTLPNPLWVINGIITDKFNAFKTHTTYPIDANQLNGFNSFNENGFNSFSENGFNSFSESYFDYYTRKAWQIRQWESGKKKFTNPTATAGDIRGVYPTYDFTRIVTDSGYYYEGFTTIVNSPGSGTVGALFDTPGAPQYIHKIIPGPNKVEFRCSHYTANYFPWGAPSSGTSFADYVWPSPNHGPALKDAFGNVVDIHLFQTFIAFQKAVVKVNSLPGNALTNTNTTYVNKNSLDEFEWDTTPSYGGDLSYFWTVEKSINNGPWTNAIGGGTDFTLMSGSLVGKGVVKFKFTGPPAAQPPIRYRCTFKAIGYSTIVSGNPERNNPYISVPNNVSSKGDSGPNSDSWFFIAEIVGPNTATQTVTTKTLPIVLPKVAPTTNVNNSVITVLPTLEAWKILEAKAEVMIDARVAIKSTTTTIYNIVGNSSTIAGGPTTVVNIPSDPVVTTANDPSKAVWLSEILTEHNIEVQLRTYNALNVPVVIGAKQGIGPHIFIVPVGKYDIVVKLFAKPKQIVPAGITANISGPPMQSQ